MSVDPDSPIPVYRQVADDLERRIRSGEYTRRMPSIQSVRQMYGVAQGSVEHAYKVLRERGVVVVVEGRGHWVNPG